MSDDTQTPESTPAAEPTEATVASEAASGPEAVTAAGSEVAPAAEAQTVAAAEAVTAAVTEPEPAAAPEPEPEPEPVGPALPTDPRPYLVLTAIVDASARAAAVCRAHGDELERAQVAAEGQDLAGLDVVELPVAPVSFGALRRQLQLPDSVVAVYDLFPLCSHLSKPVRKVAGQFLAAEILWALDEQGLLNGVPLNFRLEVPRGWDRTPKDVHAKLLEAGALNLTESAIETFKTVKGAYDRARAS